MALAPITHYQRKRFYAVCSVLWRYCLVWVSISVLQRTTYIEWNWKLGRVWVLATHFYSLYCTVLYWIKVIAAFWMGIFGEDMQIDSLLLGEIQRFYFLFILFVWNIVWTLFLIRFRFFAYFHFQLDSYFKFNYDTNGKLMCVYMFVCHFSEASTKLNKIFKWENPLNIQYTSWPLWMRWHQRLSFVVNDIIMIDINTSKSS